MGTGASSEEGAASTKEIPAGEGSGEVMLDRCAANKFYCFGLGRFARRREMGAVPRWSSRYDWGSSWDLGGGLSMARIGGIGYILVPWWTERGEDFVADRTSAIKGGVLTPTVEAERGAGIATSCYRFLKTPFWAAVVDKSVGRKVVGESADQARLCLFFAKLCRVTKTPALPALGGLGGRVGGSDHAGAEEKTDGFANTGYMKRVDRHTHQGCQLLNPFPWISL